jgi:hypothetical protein
VGSLDVLNTTETRIFPIKPNKTQFNEKFSKQTGRDYKIILYEFQFLQKVKEICSSSKRNVERN